MDKTFRPVSITTSNYGKLKPNVNKCTCFKGAPKGREGGCRAAAPSTQRNFKSTNFVDKMI